MRERLREREGFGTWGWEWRKGGWGGGGGEVGELTGCKLGELLAVGGGS